MLTYGTALFGIGSLSTPVDGAKEDGPQSKNSTGTFWSTLIHRAGRSPAALGRAILKAVVESGGADDLPGKVRTSAIVYVGTVHQLKGLEADHVVIAALDEGRFPHENEDSPEGRFVWYVALTRARTSLGYLLALGNSMYLPRG